MPEMKTLTINGVTYNIRDSSAAPAGYGLGENVPVDIDHLDLANRIGWFRSNEGMESLGLTSGWWFGNYIPYGDNEGVWELNHYLDGLKANIHKVNGVLQPAEWVNPPMTVGVEYRTTERFNGKPVYAKVITYAISDVGSSAGITDVEIPHNISDFGGIVRCNATCSGSLTLPYMYGTNSNTSVYQVTATNIVLRIINDIWYSGYFVFTIHYTKA